MKKPLFYLIYLLLSTCMLHAQVSKTINVEEAGGLSLLLTNQEQETVTKLTISGYLNGTDIKLLRLLIKDKSLTELDMTDASIVTGGESYNKGYLEIDQYTSKNEIGQMMFSELPNLKSFSCPKDVTSISYQAFANCTNLVDFISPVAPSYSMDSNVFMNCTSLQKIHFSEGLRVFGWHVFMNCTSLSDISLPSSLKQIWHHNFSGCTALKNIVLPDNLTDIGDYNFSNCANLESIVLPANLTKLGVGNFPSTTVLTDIYCKSMIAPSSESTLYRHRYPGVKLHIPEGSYDSYKSTEGWKDFQSIESEITVYSIIVNVASSGTLASLLDTSKQASIEKLYLYGLLNGADIKLIRKLITSEKLTHLDMENSTIVAGGDAYYSGENDEMFTEYNVIGEKMFTGLERLDYIYLPKEVVHIKEEAFSKCASLSKVVMPHSLISIGARAFEDCFVLNSFNTPYALENIGERSFANCRNITYFSVPEKVTSVGDSTFYGCSNLLGINFSSQGQLQNIGEKAFAYCVKLTNVTLPNSIQSIGENIFLGCSGLEQLLLSKGLINIPSGTFEDCSNLSTISLSENISGIGESAFSGCTKLLNIYCHNPEPPTCFENSFDEKNYSSANVIVPENSIDKYKNADVWMNFASINANNNEVFPTSDATWAIMHNAEDKPYVYSLYGDTIINDLVYQKLYYLNDTILSTDNSDTYVAGIRQKDKKVWIKPAVLSDGFEFEEYLLYDFSASYGDKISFGNMPYTSFWGPTFEYAERYVREDVVGTVMDERMTDLGRTLSVYAGDEYDAQWIEGIGSLSGLFYGTYPQTTCCYQIESGPILTCMKKGNQVVYKNPRCMKCFDPYVFASIENEKESTIQVKYLKESQIIEIVSETGDLPVRFDVISIDGKVIKTLNIIDTYTSLNANQLPQGVYIYTIKGKKISQSGKFIIN